MSSSFYPHFCSRCANSITGNLIIARLVGWLIVLSHLLRVGDERRPELYVLWAQIESEISRRSPPANSSQLTTSQLCTFPFRRATGQICPFHFQSPYIVCASIHNQFLPFRSAWSRLLLAIPFHSIHSFIHCPLACLCLPTRPTRHNCYPLCVCVCVVLLWPSTTFLSLHSFITSIPISE